MRPEELSCIGRLAAFLVKPLNGRCVWRDGQGPEGVQLDREPARHEAGERRQPMPQGEQKPNHVMSHTDT